jgi:tetratricopeptide (TPR) repeat protein
MSPPPPSTSAQQFLTLGRYAVKRGDFDEAIRFYSEAIALDSEYIDAYNSRGLAYHRRANAAPPLDYGDLNRALRDFNKALDIDPFYPHAYYNRARVYHQLGECDEAIDDYEVYLALGSNSTLLRQANYFLQQCRT